MIPSHPKYLECGKTLPQECLNNIEAFFNTFDIYFLDAVTANIKKSFAGAMIGFLRCLPQDYYLDVIDLYCVFNTYLGLRYKESMMIEPFQELMQHCATRIGYNYLSVSDSTLYEDEEIVNIFKDKPGTYILFISDFDLFLKLLDSAEDGEGGLYIEVDDTSKYIEEVLNLKYLLIDFLDAKVDGTQEQEREDGDSDEEDEDEEEYY